MKLTGRADKARGLLRTHLWLVVLATCVAVGAAYATASAKPVTYTATAEVVVSPAETHGGGTPLAPDMGTERAIAESGVVVQRGAAAMQLDEATVRKSLSVSIVLETRVLHISYASSTPEAAFRGASVLATSYVDYRNRRGTDGAATLVTPPSVPTSGSRGSLPLFLVLGLVAGLTVGVAAAWLWDRVSDRVRSAAELTQLTGLPILTRMRRWESRHSPLPPGGAARESFAFVAARLTSMSGRGGTTIVVTSPRTGAGATSVACGTAAALAAQGKKVVLIAASHAGLRPERLLGVATSPTLIKLLSRGCSPELALHPTAVRNLRMVPTRSAPGMSLELEDVHLVLQRMDRRAFVVIDAPPVLTSADALLLADAADHVILVGDLRSGTRTDVREALALLDDVRPKLAGWVANRPPRRRRRASPPQQVRVARPRATSDSTAGGLGEAARPVTPPAGPVPDRNGHERDRSATAAMKARPRPDMRLPDAPRTMSPARDRVPPVRAPHAAARRR
jgi:Mrp family chromosome partitioning ATPase